MDMYDCLPADLRSHCCVAGNYTGQLEVLGSTGRHDSPAQAAAAAAAPKTLLFTVPVKVEVWDIDLPHLNDTNSFNTAFNFNSDMSGWYPAGTSQETMWADWLPFLAHHRIPGDSEYFLQMHRSGTAAFLWHIRAISGADNSLDLYCAAAFGACRHLPRRPTTGR
jgi:hypothetical protein